MHPVINLLLLCCVCKAAAQYEKHLYITLSPLALADLYDGASIRIGAEYSVARTAVYADAAHYVDWIGATKILPKGFATAAGLKYYLQKSVSKSKYLAFEWMHKEQEYLFDHKVIHDEIPVTMRYPMRRHVNRFAFKFGRTRYYGRWVLDWYFGGGVREIRSRAWRSPEQELILHDHSINECTAQENLIKRTGHFFTPDFVAGIKIGGRVF